MLYDVCDSNPKPLHNIETLEFVSQVLLDLCPQVLLDISTQQPQPAMETFGTVDHQDTFPIFNIHIPHFSVERRLLQVVVGHIFYLL